MILEDVHIVEEWQTMGHRVIVRGREAPGGPIFYLAANGSWERVEEGAVGGTDQIGFTLPEGALDAIVAEARKIVTVDDAVLHHLDDAKEVRDWAMETIEILIGKVKK